MLIPPTYQLTAEIVSLLTSISAHRDVISSVTVPTEVERTIRRQSTLRSSLFSAKIEGNTLTLDEVSRLPSKDQRKAEVWGILRASNWIFEREKKDITLADVLTLHSLSMKGLIGEDTLGKLRINMEAIFNSQGIAIYMPPPPKQVPALMEKFVKYANSDRERFVPIRAVLSHYIFEKIHPFLDGNGRVGRLVLQKVLAHGGFGMKGMLTLEEYLDSHRTQYYRSLEDPEKDVTDYVTFMLTAIEASALEARTLLLEKKTVSREDYLLPRRAEILRITKDQTLISMDQLKRRFVKVNERTLRFDVKRLVEDGFLVKLGTTRGVYYKIKA
jgi:Fic family protein